MKEVQGPGLLIQFGQRAADILRTAGWRGLLQRILKRLRRKPLHRGGYVLALRLDRPFRVPMPKVDVTIERVTPDNRETIRALREIGGWGSEFEDLADRLAQGQMCYIARCEGQIASIELVLEGEFFDEYLERTFQLGENEICFYGGFTPVPFRGKGIHPYLQVECARDIASRDSRKTQVITFTEASNRASLRGLTKAGFVRIGRVGFGELLGIRLHYILGRKVLPATRRRFFVERK